MDQFVKISLCTEPCLQMLETKKDSKDKPFLYCQNVVTKVYNTGCSQSCENGCLEKVGGNMEMKLLIPL